MKFTTLSPLHYNFLVLSCNYLALHKLIFAYFVPLPIKIHDHSHETRDPLMQLAH